MRKLIKQNSRGDTIIEVLISLAILGFALTTAYSIMNRSLITARSAQEHSEAVEYLNSQVEMLRFAASQPALFTQTDKFCIKDQEIVPSPDAAKDPRCQVGDDGIYVISIERSETIIGGGLPRQQIFTFSVDWPGPGPLGPQKEQLSYKVYEVGS